MHSIKTVNLAARSAMIGTDRLSLLGLERFGLRIKKGANGYTIHYASSGNPISIPPFDARRDCSHKDVCEFVEDLELAERLKRSGVWTELLS